MWLVIYLNCTFRRF